MIKLHHGYKIIKSMDHRGNPNPTLRTAGLVDLINIETQKPHYTHPSIGEKFIIKITSDRPANTDQHSNGR